MLSTVRERDFSRKRMDDPGTGTDCQLMSESLGRIEGMHGWDHCYLTARRHAKPVGKATIAMLLREMILCGYPELEK
jgi:hypothetical protein